MSRKGLFWLLRFALSCGVLFVVLQRLDYSQLAILLPNLAVPFIMLSLVLVLLDRALMAFRWNLLLRARQVFIPLVEVFRIYLVTGFLGMFLPSSVAPDFMRAYLAMKYHCDGGVALSSVFWDRFLAFLTLAFVASVSCLVLLGLGDSGLISPSVLVIVFGLFVASSLFMVTCKYLVRVFEKVPLIQRFQSIQRLLESFRECLISYVDGTADLLRVAFLCFVNHAVFIFTVYCVTLALNVEVSLISLCALIPLVAFVTILPVSINGLGVQEGAYVYLLSRTGVSIQEAFAVALLVRIVTTMGSLPGGLLYLTGGFEAKRLTVV